ncbi:MAG: hypothetical protein GC185_13060 [Alphaproteobacteria bacterium]|nr:hypothetical protein [Alphaproteobacteria bacterium]
MRLTPVIALLLCFAFAAPHHARAAGAQARVAVTVMPFVALDDDGQAWMGKALSDLVGQQLQASGGFDVLERDRLQGFIREMELQESGFAAPENVKRVGALAKVDQVIYGNYSLSGGLITLHLMEMDVKRQLIVRDEGATGSAADLQSAVDKLVADFLKKRGEAPAGSETQQIRYRATDSVPALRHFYEGMDLYDKGKYQDAYGAFLLAARGDDKYLDARLWAARMLEYTGQDEQAALSYKKLYDAAPAAVEGRDALFFAARLLEKSDPDAAAGYYKTIADIMPKAPESLEAESGLARVLEAQGKHAEAYRALQGIEDFREQAVTMVFRLAGQAFHERRRDFYDALHGLMRAAHGKGLDKQDRLAAMIDVQMRNSRFFNWRDALSLYRGAVLRMVGLYRKARAEDATLEPPRGAFAVDAANPTIGEDHLGEKKSLFFQDEKYMPQWKEHFYAAIVPEGYTATGVTLSVTGRLPDPTATSDFTLRVFGFPLVKNYYNNWLGVIYGQTQQVTTLTKDIPFHGRDRDILVFQLIENRGQISNWHVTFHLKKMQGDEKPQTQTARTGDFEGAVQARLALHEDASTIADPQYIEQYDSKKRLAMAYSGPRGLWLVVSKGSLNAGDTDLWVSRSADGKSWTELSRMDVNGQSNDFAPQLVASEDGGMRLFWLSDRRGLGWELWTSALEKDEDRWSQPARVPGVALGRKGLTAEAQRGRDLPAFAATQDDHGRWLLAVPALKGGGINLLASDDAKKWKRIARVDGGKRFYDPVLFQDKTGVYWLGALNDDVMFKLMKSFDLKTWREKEYALGSYSRHWSDGGNGNYGSLSQIAGYPLRLFGADGGGLALLFSDTVTGLQYAFFRPDTQKPQPDLVRDVTMEPYAAARTGRGNWLVAVWQGDDIVLRHYHRFAFAANEENAASDPLYHETEFDAKGDRWDRRIARTRFVMPDVTAVGVADDGRAWWGIETGVMALKGKNFYVADVSMGFFDHHATDIVPCGDKVYFASRALPRAVLGVISRRWFTRKTEKIELPALSGGVSAIACGKDGVIYLGTSGGDAAAVSGADVLYRHHLDKAHPTTLAAQGDGAWLGTSSGGLYYMTKKGLKRETYPKDAAVEPVTSLSANGKLLWMASEGGGLRLRDHNGWKQFTPAKGNFPYASPGKIKAWKNGVWFMPDAYTVSKGIGYFENGKAQLYQPPSHDIFDIVDFDVAPDGAAWVGSESSGIYRLERGAR